MSTSTPMYTTLDGGLQTVVSEETMREWEIRAGNYDLPIVYLDFDGASISSASWTEGHYIQDEIEFDDIVVKNSGIKNSTIVSIVSKLNEWYSGQLVFTTEIPAGEYGEDYHTIFVGKTDAFGEYGNYLCVNAYWELEDDEGDGYIGFVLLDSAASTELLLNCIAHEACGGLWSGDDDGFFRAYCKVDILNSAVSSGTTLSKKVIAYETNNTIVLSGGKVSSATVKRSGELVIASGGTAISTTIFGDEELDDDWFYEGNLIVCSGGIAKNTIVMNRGNMVVKAGGTATEVVADECTELWFEVASGTYVQGTSAGRSFVISNGLSKGVFEYGGLKIFPNVTVISTTLGDSENMVVMSGASVTSTIVNQRGELIVYSGGTAKGVTVNSNGFLEVSAGGAASGVKITSGGYVNLGLNSNTYLQGSYNGSSFIVQKGLVSGVNFLRFLDVYSGGTALSTTLDNGSLYVCSGGTALFTTVNTYGLVTYSGGIASATTVRSSGWYDVYSGGIAKDTTISSGGRFNFCSHFGTLQIASGAIVSAHSGAVIDFTVAEQQNRSGALIDHYDRIRGAADANYTITVRENQATGQYALAGYAGNFNNTVSVKTVSGQSLGTFSVGDSLSANNFTYSLAITPGATLQLTIAVRDTMTPTITNIQADVATPTNGNVTVSAVFADDVELAQSLYRLGNSGTWLNYTGPVTITANGTVYFKAVDTAGNAVEAQYNVTNIDKTPPAKPTACADITAMTNQDVTITVTFSSDSAQKQYSYNNRDWSSYTSGVVVSANGTVYFRGIDAAGNVSEVTPYMVTNIDKTAPSRPVVKVNITSMTSQNVVVTATFSNDSTQKQYSLDNETWTSYTQGVVMSANGTVWFRGIDAAGNISAVTAYEVTNIDKVAPSKISGLSATTKDGVATFSWQTTTDNLSGVAKYEIEVSDQADFSHLVDSQSGASLTSFSTGYVGRGTYYYRVRATDSAGNVSQWSTASVDYQGAAVAELLIGTTGDDAFVLTPDGAWGTYHVARWNGGEEMVSLAGFYRFYDAVTGGGGYDVLQLPSGDNGLLYSDLLSPSAEGADADGRLAGIAEIDGGAGKDIIDLTDASGGYAGDILLKGGSGDDHLWAGSGDDILIGGTGDDDLRGGSGDDVYLFDANWGHDAILDDGGTLVFDNALKNRLSFSATADGTRITDGQNTLDLTWSVTSSAVLYADVASLTEMRRDTIKGFLA